MDLHEPETRTHVMSKDYDDDYIDMEINLSSSTSQPSSFIDFEVTSSPPQSREFEFQMCSTALASGESTTSPADDLFYKGQLLPLHLPPRLQMVQKLLATSSSTATKDTLTSPCAAASSPRRLSSSEIDVRGTVTSLHKIKQSSITQKLKASRAYIRSLFSRPEIHPTLNIKNSTTSKNKNPLEKQESSPLSHRRSFSGVINRPSPAKCTSSSSSSRSSISSSFSFGSNGSLDLQTLMRSSNASLEVDNSIAGAIEHCRQSFTTRKSNVAESEFSSSRTSVSACGDFEK